MRADNHKKMTLDEPGSYGWLLKADIPYDVAAKSTNGTLTIRLEAEKGGLAVYGANFGRYPLDPTILCNGEKGDTK